MRFLAIALLMVGVVCVLGLQGDGALAVTVVDGDFSDWSFAQISDGAGTGYWQRHTSGGNPGAYAETWMYAPITVTAQTLLWKNDFVWDPATDGCISTITLEIDERAISSGGAGQAVKILVVQGGRYYGAPRVPWAQHVTGTGGAWETLVFDPADVDDFGETPPPAGLDPNEKPDFSASGGPIQFGFLTGNTYTLDPRHHAYDNWTLTIVGGGPSETHITAWGKIKALYK